MFCDFADLDHQVMCIKLMLSKVQFSCVAGESGFRMNHEL